MSPLRGFAWVGSVRFYEDIAPRIFARIEDGLTPTGSNIYRNMIVSIQYDPAGLASSATINAAAAVGTGRDLVFHIQKKYFFN